MDWKVGYLHPAVVSGMAWDTSPMLPARLHTIDRALSASQPQHLFMDRQNDCPLLSWVVKDGHLATRKPGYKRASGANGMGRIELEA